MAVLDFHAGLEEGRLFHAGGSHVNDTMAISIICYSYNGIQL